MYGQKSPAARVKIEAAFARLNKLGSGNNGDDVPDAQESMRRANLSALVTPAPLESTLH